MSSWEPIEMELVHGDFLLRVCRTHSPSRFRWFVAPLAEINKFGARWANAQRGKGASCAEAKGYSSTFEKAQADAVAMADAIVKSEKVNAAL